MKSIMVRLFNATLKQRSDPRLECFLDHMVSVLPHYTVVMWDYRAAECGGSPCWGTPSWPGWSRAWRSPWCCASRLSPAPHRASGGHSKWRDRRRSTPSSPPVGTTAAALRPALCPSTLMHTAWHPAEHTHRAQLFVVTLHNSVTYWTSWSEPFVSQWTRTANKKNQWCINSSSILFFLPEERDHSRLVSDWLQHLRLAGLMLIYSQMLLSYSCSLPFLWSFTTQVGKSENDTLSEKLPFSKSSC